MTNGKKPRPLTDEEEAAIQRQIASDPEAPELTHEQLKTGRSFAEAFPHIRTFTTPGGEEMVILPRAEYDALVEAAADAEEDAADAAIYAQRKAALERGED